MHQSTIRCALTVNDYIQYLFIYSSSNLIICLRFLGAYSSFARVLLSLHVVYIVDFLGINKKKPVHLHNGATFGASVRVTSQYVTYVHRYLSPSRMAEYATFDPQLPL